MLVKSSKHVQICLVSANDDFDNRSTYIYCFLHEKKIWTKFFKNGHCVVPAPVFKINVFY